MIDELGLKGFAVGDARVSDRHANFFINAGHASAADMLALIAGVRERVRGPMEYSRIRGGRLERLKPMQRNSSAAAAAADQEPYRPELVADEEPRYLRRQKPVEIAARNSAQDLAVLSPRVSVDGDRRVTVAAAVYAVRYALYRRKCSW